jgi:non-ribosomal peptide synthetase component F
MLSRLAGQDEVVVGTPSAGRVLSGSEALIGFFVNTLALRLTPGMSQTLGGYLDTVTNTVREGLEHEAAPFELVVERASVERSLAHTPVFQAALSWQHQEAGGLDLPGVSLSPRVLALPQAKHDLSLILVVGKDREISGAIEYDADLFMSETVERWTTILLNTLDQFCAPGSLTAPLSALCLTPASDLAAI